MHAKVAPAEPGGLPGLRVGVPRENSILCGPWIFGTLLRLTVLVRHRAYLGRATSWTLFNEFMSNSCRVPYCRKLWSQFTGSCKNCCLRGNTKALWIKPFPRAIRHGLPKNNQVCFGRICFVNDVAQKTAHGQHENDGLCNLSQPFHITPPRVQCQGHFPRHPIQPDPQDRTGNCHRPRWTAGPSPARPPGSAISLFAAVPTHNVRNSRCRPGDS